MPHAHRCGGCVLQGRAEACVGVFRAVGVQHHAACSMVSIKSAWDGGCIGRASERSSCSTLQEAENLRRVKGDRVMIGLSGTHAAVAHATSIHRRLARRCQAMRSRNRTSPLHAPEHCLLILFHHLTNLDQDTRSQRPDLRLLLTPTTD